MTLFLYTFIRNASLGSYQWNKIKLSSRLATENAAEFAERKSKEAVARKFGICVAGEIAKKFSPR